MITKINGVYSLTDEADVLNLPTKGVQLGSIAQLTKDNGDSTVYIFTKDMSTENTSWVKVPEVDSILADIREVNEQLDNIEIEKASKVELEVERQRIELLTKVENGQTEGNTELLDLRIASDGLEYESAGRSIRTQINNVNKTVSETEILNPTFKSGYISKNSALNSHENYNYSEPIFLKKGEIIKVQTKGESGVVSIISETDEKATKYTSLVTDDGTIKHDSLKLSSIIFSYLMRK